MIEVHELTKKYEDINKGPFTAVDDIAERMRALGGEAPGTMKEFLAISTLKEGAGGPDFGSMIDELLNAHDVIAPYPIRSTVCVSTITRTLISAASVETSIARI